MKYLKYRPEIDGLRAIAVLSVIIFHFQIYFLDFRIISGGYLGVDIFFVISGYLISSLLYKEYLINQKINFLYFYIRRVRRLLPLLFFVSIITIIFAWYIVLPSEFLDLLHSIYNAITFRANFYFQQTGSLYGADISDIRPFLHTWSLSAEEQFYFLFPLFFLLILIFLKRILIILLFIGILLSLALAEWGSIHYPNFMFYMLPSRGWELLTGVLITCLENKKNKNKIFIFIQNKGKYFFYFGFILIILSIIFINDSYRHPSIITVPVVLGTFFIIGAKNHNNIVYKFLTSKILVFIGLISYSLYLWHYPVLALSRILEYSSSIDIQIIFKVLLIFTLSCLSYFFIEKPFRSREFISNKLIIIIVSMCFITTIILFYLVKNHYNYKDNIKNNFAVEKIYLDNNYYKEQWDKQNKINTQINFKNMELENILIIGNSYAADTFNMFNQNLNLFSNYEFVLFIRQIKCLTKLNLDKNNILIGNKKINKSLAKIVNKGTTCGIQVFEHDVNINYDLKLSENDIKNFNNADTIFISSKFYDEDLQVLEEVAKLLKKTKKKIVFFNNTHEFVNFGNLTLIDKFLLKNKKIPTNKEIEIIERQYFQRYKNNLSEHSINTVVLSNVNKQIENIANKYKFKFIDKSNYYCKKLQKKCYVLTDQNKKIYWDREHTTLEGAKFFGIKIHQHKMLD